MHRSDLSLVLTIFVLCLFSIPSAAAAAGGAGPDSAAGSKTGVAGPDSQLPAPDISLWGRDGHKAICLMAWWEMKPETRQAVRTLLAGDGAFDRFMESCLWADQVRGDDPAYDRYTTAHYVNLPREATAFRLERDCADTFCAVEAITETLATLERPGASFAERLVALKFLAHFVGDLHQPSHAGYGFDRGGNDTAVTAFGEPSNVHRVWDFVLIERTYANWVDMASHLYFDIDDADREAWESLNPARWAEESHSIMRETAYDFGASGEVDEAYRARNITIIETRMQTAAVRLARLLDAAL